MVSAPRKAHGNTAHCGPRRLDRIREWKSRKLEQLPLLRAAGTYVFELWYRFVSHCIYYNGYPKQDPTTNIKMHILPGRLIAMLCDRYLIELIAKMSQLSLYGTIYIFIPDKIDFN